MNTPSAGDPVLLTGATRTAAVSAVTTPLNHGPEGELEQGEQIIAREERRANNPPTS